MRSHSERILATATNAKPIPLDQGFIDQLARMPLIETLYGAVKKKDAGGSHVGRGALHVDDCLAKMSLSMSDRQAIADGWMNEYIDSSRPSTKSGNDKVRTATEIAKALTDAEIAKAQNSAGSSGIDVAMHVAIDRWTGGAAEGALFSAAEPRIEWNPILIEVDTARLVPGPADMPGDTCRLGVPQAAVALLLHTLRDMAAGLIPLGSGTNRGYGDIGITSIVIAAKGGATDHWCTALDGLKIVKAASGGGLQQPRTAGGHRQGLARLRGHMAGAQRPREGGMTKLRIAAGTAASESALLATLARVPNVAHSGFFYSARETAAFVRFENGAPKDHNGKDAEPRMAAGYEIRLFDAQREIRARRNGDEWRLAVISEAANDPIVAALGLATPRVAVTCCATHDIRYSLWGKATSSTGTWTKMVTERIGSLWVPHQVQVGGRIAMKAIEYFKVGVDGNVVYAAERLIGFAEVEVWSDKGT